MSKSNTRCFSIGNLEISEMECTDGIIETLNNTITEYPNIQYDKKLEEYFMDIFNSTLPVYGKVALQRDIEYLIKFFENERFKVVTDEDVYKNIYEMYIFDTKSKNTLLFEWSDEKRLYNFSLLRSYQ